MKALLLFLSICLTVSLSGQQLNQTIRGMVKDKETLEPLIGVKVELVNSNPYYAVVTDFNGSFRLTNVPVGRQTIVVSYLGYLPVVLSNLDINSKELVLNIDMQESVEMMKEVIVTGNKEGETNNKMTSVSSRSFSIEESKRYAGSLNDVSRMAQNFAGVQGGNDSRNDIIVRGNSPTGVLYKLEGIDIPNPNHFARFGTTGGPMSMLNNNVLAKSDFLTGAFPAEYGNATAAVFDLKMRNGNNEKHEFMFQFGFNGAELMAEGPISKKHKSSYMLSYRYNDLSFFQFLNLNIGTNAVPKYQDLSFKLNFPHKNGVTNVFGIGGTSSIFLRAEVVDTNDLYSVDNSNTFFDTKVGVIGVNHKRRIGDKSYINFTTAYQIASNDILNDTLDVNLENPFRTYANKSRIGKLSSSVFYNKKFSAKHVIKTGVQLDLFVLNLVDSFYYRPIENYLTLRNFQGNSLLIQPYAQYQYKPSNILTFNVGVHYQMLTLNNKGSLEPRAGMSLNTPERGKFSLGYGLHSQMLPMELYFREVVENGTVVRPNERLDFSKSHHFITSYQHAFNYGISAKVEAYYQYLFSVPVSQDSSTYSLSNFGSSFTESFPLYMSNKGTGSNYGLDFTLEKYLDKGFYFLLTSSLYRSNFVPSNGELYNSAFDGNYTFNALVGYEYKFKQSKKFQSSITIDLKFIRNGGNRYTPILLEESIAQDKEIFDYDNAFSQRYPDYTKGDIRIGFKLVGKKVTQEWAIDIQNFTNRKNVFLRQYDNNKQSITTTYQTGRLPIGLYRIYF
jgi:hypothetical protein